MVLCVTLRRLDARSEEARVRVQDLVVYSGERRLLLAIEAYLDLGRPRRALFLLLRLFVAAVVAITGGEIGGGWARQHCLGSSHLGHFVV